MRNKGCQFVIFCILLMSMSSVSADESIVCNFYNRKYVVFSVNSSFFGTYKYMNSTKWSDYKDINPIYKNNKYEWASFIKIENNYLVFGDGDYGNIKNIIIYDLKNEKYICKDEYYGTIENVNDDILYKEIESDNIEKYIDEFDMKSINLAMKKVNQSDGNCILQYYSVYKFNPEKGIIENCNRIIAEAIP